MTPLSVVIITLNEEKNIAQCIQSVQSIADEILVVDSFSTDNTKQICIESGVRFIEHPFENYVAQKNFATENAAYDFILSIDADEVLSEELIASIQKIKQNTSADGYTFNRLNNYCGKWIKHGGWYPDKKLRIYNRNKAKWTGIKIHEKITLEPDAKHEFIKGNLLHYSFRSIDEHILQAHKFSTLSAESAVNKGRTSNLAKAILFPFWRFIRNYIIKRGFLDGYYGLVVCAIVSHENFLKYIKMIELQNSKTTTL